MGFTEKLSIDCHHKGHIVSHHYSNSLVSGCNLNWFDTTVYRSMELNNCQCLWLPSIVCKSLKEPVHVDSVLLAALEQFEYIPSSTCTNRLLLAVLEEPEDSDTTRKEDVKKTPAKMLPSILTKHCMRTIPICVL